MLATLERPLDSSVRQTGTSTRANRLTLLAPPPALHIPAPVPDLSDGAYHRPRSAALITAPVGQPRPQSFCRGGDPALARESQAARLRLTVRARRLLAGIGLLCAVGVGVVAVDVMSALVPNSPESSYAIQFAPYQGSADADGLAVASGSSIVVASGDTLWSVARRVAPHADPRSVIAAIMTLNGLESSNVEAGQVLLVP